MRAMLAAATLVCLWPATAVAQESVPTPPTEQTTPAPEPGPFRKLFSTIGRDLKRLPSADTARLAINGGMMALAAYPFDDAATLGASSSVFLKASFSGWGKALGREWVQGGGALAAYVAGRVLDKPTITAVGGDLIEAQLLSVTLTQGLKFATQRTRPDGEARSFPSGHASAAFATATVLQRHFGPKAAVPAYAIAAYTSASRLQANSHFASDVIMGATLGMIVGRTATIDLPQSRLHITPAPAAGGLMVMGSINRR